MKELTPLVAVHITAALSAVAIGPFALWARLGRTQHPKLHRAFGYAWVTMMLVAATSAIFIQGTSPLPRLGGFSPIHLLILVTYAGLFFAFRYLIHGNIDGHKKTMQRIYITACLITGVFTLLPGRLMNHLIFG